MQDGQPALHDGEESFASHSSPAYNADVPTRKLTKGEHGHGRAASHTRLY